MPDVFKFPARQGQPATFTARKRLTTGALITQATISEITFKVFDLRASPRLETMCGTVEVADCVFDVLQKNPILWPIDMIGYNFLWTTPQNAFPNAPNGQAYLVEVVFEEADSGLLTSLSFLSSEVTPVQSVPL